MFGDLFGEDDDVNQSSGNGNSSSRSSNNHKRTYARKPNEKRSPHGFVGLLNQGATCYLNSLLQLLYMTPELKNKLYTLTLEDFGLESNENTTTNTNTTTTTTTSTNDQNGTSEPSFELPDLIEASSILLDMGSGDGNHSVISNTSTVSTLGNGIERPSNPSIAIKTSQQQKEQRDRDAAKRNHQQQEEEFDYRILESDYFQNLLSFGFEEHKLIEGLKKFPHEHQQERLVDWILCWEDRLMNDISSSVFTSLMDDQVAPINGLVGPLTREQYDSLENCTDISGLKHNDNQSFKSENYDAFFDSNVNISSPSTAIVVYDENQHKLPISDLISTSDTSTTNGNDNSSTKTTTTTAASKKKKGRRISYELQKLFALLQEGNVNSISTEDLTKSFGWNDSQSLYQHDIHELNRILFDAVEHSIKNTPIENVFNELYKGSFRNRIECSKCQTCKDIVEFYLDLPVSVKGTHSVLESLNSFIKPEILDGKNMYSCETCNEKVKAKFSQRIDKLPPVLHMCLNRFDYDLDKGKRVKLNHRFEFPNQIDLLPYTTDYDNYEKQLEALKLENPELTEKEISKILPKPKEKIYELFAVLIHSGGAFGGHYHSYIKDLLKLGSNSQELPTSNAEIDEKDKLSQFNTDSFSNWFDFNDSQVLPIKDRSIIQQFGGKAECAYMLIYRDVEYNKSIEMSKIPTHFEGEVMSFNLKLEQQRNTYEKTINTMFLYPKFQSDFQVRDGFLWEEQKQKDAIQELESDHLVLQIDVSSTVDDLFAMIDQKYPSEVEKLGGPGNYVIQEITIKNGKITSIQPPIQPNSQLNVKRTGLREASQFIVWKGEEQSGLPIKPIHYSIKFYKGQTSKQFNLAIGKDSTFKDLEKQIAEVVGIEVSKLSIFIGTPQSIILLEDDPNIPLSNRIQNGVCLLVEEKPETSGSSLVFKDFELNKNKIQIFVKDKFFVDRSKNSQLSQDLLRDSFKVLVDPKSTIYDLKSIILDASHHLELNKQDWMDKTIIRKTTVGGYEGSAITDDSCFLKECNINDFSLVIFEAGTPTKSSITIRYLYFKDKVSVLEHDEPATISLPKSTTLANVKREILKKLFISEELVSRYILRACDLFEKPIHIISDEDQSLEESGITSNDVIAVEEGILPSKDQIPLNIKLYSCSKEPILLQFPSSPLLHLNPIYIPQIPDLYTIHNLGICLVDRKQNLQAFKAQILKWEPFTQSKDPIIHFNPEEDDIRFWLDERLLNSYNNKPLSKLNIQSEATITLEIFKIPKGGKEPINNTITESETTNENNTQNTNGITNEKNTNLPPILLYIHKRKPSEQCFQHPASQVIFHGKLISDLLKLISLEFEIEEKFIKIFKHLPNQKLNPWKVIEERNNNTNTSNNHISQNGHSHSNDIDSKVLTLTEDQFGVNIDKLVYRQNEAGVEVNPSDVDLPLILTGFIQVLSLLDAQESAEVFSDKGVSFDVLMKEREIVNRSPIEYMSTLKDVNLVGSLFKQWLRELPTSLIPSSIHRDLAECPDQAYDIFRLSASHLHFRALDFILDFIVQFFEADAIQKSNITPQQLALDLAPVLMNGFDNSNDSVKVVESLINHKYSLILSKMFSENEDLSKFNYTDIVSSNSNSTINSCILGNPSSYSSSSINRNNSNSSSNSVPPPPPPMKKKSPANNTKTLKNELRGKPYLLKDGDIISFIDTREDPEGLDKFAMSASKFDNFSTRYSKGPSGEKYSYGPNRSTYKPKEVSLTIELDDY